MAGIRGATRQESVGVGRARVGLLALLPLIAWGVYWEGQRYDPGLLDFKNAAARLSPLVALFPERAEGLARLGETRRFDRESLHEYVNGHAEFFISAGFKELVVGEYGLPQEASRPKVVVDLYDMGKPLFAFGVLTGEGGDGGPEAGVGEMGFAESRGLRFISGPYYVKMTAFDEGAPLKAMGQALVKAMGQAGVAKAQGFRFPEFGKPLATRFIKENYRGLDFFDQVVERSFQRGDQTIQAFQVMGSEARNLELESKLLAFLKGEEIPVERLEKEGLVLFQVQDPYEGEWFFLRTQEQVIGAFGIPLDAAWTPLKEFVNRGQTQHDEPRS
ncbi:MAG: hypothetical protein HQL98_03160 [Magnetococcales bacterium]|nr:hypothetical protein [Magnetococcales bacterium]